MRRLHALKTNKNPAQCNCFCQSPYLESFNSQHFMSFTFNVPIKISCNLAYRTQWVYRSCYLVIASLMLSFFQVQAATHVSIGTGGINGVYHPAGGAICRMMNKQRQQHGIRCSVKSTGGSIFNLEAIRDNNLSMATVQSDWQYHAYHGTNKFSSQGANTKLRALFSIHPEPFTVIARADSGIRTLHDLLDKRVNVGAPGSGQRGTINILMGILEWELTDFELASELPTSEQVNALCSNKLDAIIVTVGHPSSLVKRATETCDAKIVAVQGGAIEQLIADYAYYRIAMIPGGIYSGNPNDVATFGVAGTFVTSTDVDNVTVYNVVKSVFENLDTLKTLHPAFAYLKPEEMVQDALSAPIHDGAKHYYQEAGIACYETALSENNHNCNSQAPESNNNNDDSNTHHTWHIMGAESEDQAD